MAERLVAGGWEVLARNVRVGRDELDLVGDRPRPAEDAGRRRGALARPSRLRAGRGDARPPQARGPAARGGRAAGRGRPPRRDAPAAAAGPDRPRRDRPGTRRAAVDPPSPRAPALIIGSPARSGAAGTLCYTPGRSGWSGRQPPVPGLGPRRSTHADHGPGRDGAGPGAGRETRADGPAGDPRRHNRQEVTQCPPFRCASSWRPASTSATRRAAGTPRCARSSSRSATGSTSSTSPRPSSASTRRSSSSRETVARGESVLFVGTKKQAQEPVTQEAMRAGKPYVTKRWLGGMLTNFVTIKKRIGLLDQLEARQLAGDFDRLPKKEAAGLTEELNKLNAMLGGIRKMKRLPGRHLHRRPAPRAHRRDRGQQARDPGHRHGRHERRPGRARLHHPGQRRRHPRDPAAVPAGRRRGDRGRRPARGARLVRARGPGAPGHRGARVRRDRRGRPGRPARRRRRPCRSTPTWTTRTCCPARRVPRRPCPRASRPPTRPPTRRPRTRAAD